MEGAENGGSEQASSSDDGQSPVALKKIIEKEISVMGTISNVHQEIVPIVKDLILKVFNMQVQGINNSGAEQASCSDDGQFLVALREIIQKEFKVMVIHTFHQEVVPAVEELIRKVVKEEIHSVEKRLLTGHSRYANEMTMPRERSLRLRFSDRVSETVLTGKELKGTKGSMEVYLVDQTTEQIVNCEPASSAKVEILVLDATGDDNENNWTLETFNNRIIREDDKEKPHFAKNFYIRLQEGVGVLSNAKLGHGSRYTKCRKCRLGARIVETFCGIKVQEAWTESFNVKDSRNKLYEKHHPPSLSDEVWRLENIGRKGAPCERLKEEHVLTVQQFLFLLSVDPQKLEQIVGAPPAKWEATVEHARTCSIDDGKLYSYPPPAESEMAVIFDAVGRLKWAIQESRYVPINNLSADQKDRAHKLLLAALENWEDRAPFDDQTSILQQPPYGSSDVNVSTNSIQQGSNGCDLTSCENINGHHPAEQGIISESIIPYIGTSDHPNKIYHFGSLESIEKGQMYGQVLNVPTQFPSCQSADLANTNAYAPTDPGTSSQSIISLLPGSLNPTGQPYEPHFGSPEWQTMEQHFEPHWGAETQNIESIWEDTYNNSTSMAYPEINTPHSLINSEINGPCSPINSEIYRPRSVCSVGLMVNVMLWVVRVKKKRVTTLGDIHVPKKRRISPIANEQILGFHH